MNIKIIEVTEPTMMDRMRSINKCIEILCDKKLNKDTWPVFQITTHEKNIVNSVYNDVVPDSFKKEDIFYFPDLPAIKPRVVVQTKGTKALTYCHFGDKFMLGDIIEETLIKNKISQGIFSKHLNDFLLNDKKFMGIFRIRRGGFIYESGIITLQYDDKLFKKMLPEKFYRKGHKEGETGITGLLNECPFININNFIESLKERIIYHTKEYKEIEDEGLIFGNVTGSKEFIEEELSNQLDEYTYRYIPEKELTLQKVKDRVFKDGYYY
jgi:hypothetical protein